jgi:hypothetical protein
MPVIPSYMEAEIKRIEIPGHPAQPKTIIHEAPS